MVARMQAPKAGASGSRNKTGHGLSSLAACVSLESVSFLSPLVLDYLAPTYIGFRVLFFFFLVCLCFPANLRHLCLLFLLPTFSPSTFSNPGSPKKALVCSVHLFQLSHGSRLQPTDECLWGRCPHGYRQLRSWVRQRVWYTPHPCFCVEGSGP